MIWIEISDFLGLGCSYLEHQAIEALSRQCRRHLQRHIDSGVRYLMLFVRSVCYSHVDTARHCSGRQHNVIENHKGAQRGAWHCRPAAAHPWWLFVVVRKAAGGRSGDRI